MSESPAAEQVTSERRYGIDPQPAPTCPMVDKAIDIVKDILRLIKGNERADEEELRGMLDVVERDLSELAANSWRRDGLLEDLRRQNDALRNWGQGWKELALEHAPLPEEELT